MDDDYISVSEASRVMGRSIPAVRELIRRGRLPAKPVLVLGGSIRYYLLRRQDVEDFRPLPRGPKPQASAR